MPDIPDSVTQLRADVTALQQQVAQLQERVRTLEGSRTAPAAPPESQLGSRFGLLVVNRMGAITLAIGIIFFFKYAVDNQWIGARGRLLFGTVAGLLLIAAGEWITRHGYGVFAQGIAGCGIATLYITFYAAFAYYQFLSQALAFLAFVAVCALAVALSFRYRQPAIAALGFVGGLVTPLLLQGNHPSVTFHAAYLIALDFTCLVISARQRWTTLVPGIGALTVVVAWLLLEAQGSGWFTTLTLCLAVAHGAAAFWVRTSDMLFRVFYLTGHGCFVVAMLRALEQWTKQVVAVTSRGSVVSELGSVLLAVYGIAALIYGFARHSPVNRNLGLFLLGLVMGKLYLWDIWFLQRIYRTTAFVSLGILLLVASWVYSRWHSRAS